MVNGLALKVSTCPEMTLMLPRHLIGKNCKNNGPHKSQWGAPELGPEPEPEPERAYKREFLQSFILV